MAAKTKPRFIDYLPAIFRQNETMGGNFEERFLAAFEAVFAEIQTQLDAIPDLFAVAPTPALAMPAGTGADTLHLDSAAGLCPGDMLHLQNTDPSQVEFVAVKALPLDLNPTSLTLLTGLRFAQPRGTPVRLVGLPNRVATLRRPVEAHQKVLDITIAPPPSVRLGDVVRLDADELVEYAQVTAVASTPGVGDSLTITPPLQHSHLAGRPLAFCPTVPSTTPPPVFARTAASGPELVLRAPARPGETLVELDTIAGLATGDILYLRELSLVRVEFAQIKELPEATAGLGVERFAVQLSQPLRFEHQAGLGVSVLGPAESVARLGQPAAGAESTLMVDPALVPLRIEVGEVLQVDEGAAAEFGQVVAVSDRVLTITPALQQNHAADRPVWRIKPSGNGTAFLSWLAGWLGLTLRPDRGERWNRELLRLAGRIWPWRGARVGVEAFLQAYLRGEAQATVVDLANPFQIGLVSTVGVDTVICGGVPYTFWADLITDERNSRLYHAAGLAGLVQAAHQALGQEKPAHTDYTLRLQAHTMQIGVDSTSEVGARVGETTLLWDKPLLLPGRR
jgi:hypothetical protein